MPPIALGATGSRSIYSLPDDILLLIISYISVKDIITLRKTSLKFHELTKLRWVWSDAVQRHVIDKGLPLPAAGSSIKALSAQHLETRAVHAAKFNDNWYSAQPKPRTAIEFQVEGVNSDGSPAAIKEVVFLKGRCGEFLLTLTGTSIECWEVPLDGSGAYRIAEWTDENGIEQLHVNQDPTHSVEVAYLTQDPADRSYTWIYTLSLDTFHGTFKPRSAMRGSRVQMAPIHLMHGDFVVMGDPLLVWHLTGPKAAKSMTRLINEAAADRDKILTVKMVEDVLVVVRSTSVEVFRSPVWSATEGRYTSQGYAISALSIDAHPAREAVVMTRPNAGSDPFSSSLLPRSLPVTVLLLQSSQFLGLHTISQLDLLPATTPRCETSAPFAFPAEVTRIYQVAASACSLKVSSNGKGIWMQTHNITSRHAKYPARCIMGFDLASASQQTASEHSQHKDPQVVLLKDKPSSLQGANDLHMCNSQLYARRCDMSEILRRKYTLIAADLEDSVGRIAVGDRCGKVEVLDYV